MVDGTLDTKKTDEDDALNSIYAARDSLIAVIGICEELRQFLGVLRLSIQQQDTMLSKTLINVMIDRVDPVLQDLYKDIPDEDLIDIVTERLASPKILNDTIIEHIQITDEDKSSIL